MPFTNIFWENRDMSKKLYDYIINKEHHKYRKEYQNHVIRRQQYSV